MDSSLREPSDAPQGKRSGWLLQEHREMSRFAEKLKDLGEEVLCRRLCAGYSIGEGNYKRIYHIHIRKTGGTSLNYMFHALAKNDGWSSSYAELTQVPHHRVVRDKLVFVGWDGKLINKGYYFYAFSHMPVHWLRLKPRTFTITCFRDPCRRVISHYNMLMELVVNRVPHVCLETEGPWLGRSFDEFLERIPRDHLQNQLYMFSSKFDESEALENVRNVSHVMFTEDFVAGVRELNRKTGLHLEPIHTRKTGYKAEISDAGMARLREKLSEEYDFIEKVKSSLPR